LRWLRSRVRVGSAAPWFELGVAQLGPAAPQLGLAMLWLDSVMPWVRAAGPATLPLRWRRSVAAISQPSGWSRLPG
jgi:hypothetical protein